MEISIARLLKLSKYFSKVSVCLLPCSMKYAEDLSAKNRKQRCEIGPRLVTPEYICNGS